MRFGGIIELANERAALLLGASPAQLVGARLSDFVEREDRRPLRLHLRRVFREGEAHGDVVRMAGKSAQLSSSRSTTRYERGRVCRSVLVDVSSTVAAHERAAWLHRATVAVHATLDEREALTELADLTVPAFADACAVDLLGDGPPWASERVATVAVDDECLAALALGAPVSQPVREPCAFAAPNGGVVLLVPIVHADAWYGVITLLVGAERQSSGSVFENHELSVAVELAARAAAAVKNCRLHDAAKRSLRSRERMLSIVSHDLRNALSVMTLGLGPLLRTPDGQADRRRGRRHLEALKRGVQRMDRLVSDLVDVSSIEAGRLSIAIEHCDAGMLLDEIVEAAAPAAADKGVRLTVERDIACTIRCDRVRVHQVFANLLGNAVKFVEPSGAVTVRAESTGTHLHVAVRDDGPGIDAELQRDLFTPYAQARRTAKQGRGLGLFIARRIVEAHGGRLSVESRPGHGCTFHVVLPLNPAPAA
ncbi:MAG TPA: PAS domain-containing sensor histidine kinase [Myxococcota bacterium]